MNLRISGFVFALLLFARAPTAATADSSASKEVILDGLSAVVGGSPADELSRTPLLVSDVLFQSRVLQIIRGEAAGLFAPAGDKLLAAGRRSAVFMRLLAGNARRLKETVPPRTVAAIRARLAKLAGGELALAAVMAQAGYSEADLTRWIEDAVLASNQVRYALDQARLELTPTAGDPDEGPDPDLETETQGLGTRQAVREVIQWLESILAEQHLRILR